MYNTNIMEDILNKIDKYFTHTNSLFLFLGIYEKFNYSCCNRH